MKTETIKADGYETEDLLLLSYGAFEQLKWIPKFAGPVRLIGYTKITWGQPHETITVEAGEGNLTITSQLPESASWDLMKKNQKNLAKFFAAFETIKSSATTTQQESWKEAIEKLRTATDLAVIEEAKSSEEVEKVMNLSTGSKKFTYGIMFLNVLVFVLMAIAGVSIFEPTNIDLVQWGANFKPYTVDEGQWWRLLTCTFLHIGIIHLLFNMYALYMVGLYLEPMLGTKRYLFAYLVTGITASITSIGWHGNDVISAGASGAIFGLYGVFLALLTTNLIPKAVRKALLQSIGIFMAYNLLYGMKAGVDNAAHLGGVISGFVLGYIYFPLLKREIAAEGLKA